MRCYKVLYDRNLHCIWKKFENNRITLSIPDNAFYWQKYQTILIKVILFLKLFEFFSMSVSCHKGFNDRNVLIFLKKFMNYRISLSIPDHLFYWQINHSILIKVILFLKHFEFSFYECEVPLSFHWWELYSFLKKLKNNRITLSIPDNVFYLQNYHPILIKVILFLKLSNFLLINVSCHRIFNDRFLQSF